MSEKMSDVVFGDVVVKKEFHPSKQGIALNLVHTDKLAISDKFTVKMVLNTLLTV